MKNIKIRDNINQFFNNLKKDKKTLSLLLLGFIVLGIGTSFALLNFQVDLSGKRTVTIKDCQLKVNFKEGDIAPLVSSYPISDAEAIKYEPFILKVTNNGECSPANYKITLKNICNTCIKDANNECNINNEEYDCNSSHQISNSMIKYQLVNKTTNESNIYTEINDFLISGALNTNASDEYEMRIWLNENASNSDLYVDNNNSVLKTLALSYDIEVSDTISQQSLSDKIRLTENKTGGVTKIEHEENNQLQISGITDYVYKGTSPNNYITFNNEEWRILGAFNVDDGNGNIERRVKIEKTVRISGMSSTNWGSSTLSSYYNDTYYNSIGDNYKQYIKNAKYYLGYAYDGDTYVNIYNSERLVGKTSWVGKAGLLYLSDVINITWLSYVGWLITPAHSDFLWIQDDTVFYEEDPSWGYGYNVTIAFYLDADTPYVSGDGTQSNPYTIIES